MALSEEQIEKVLKKTKWGSDTGVTAIIMDQPCAYPLGMLRSRGKKGSVEMTALTKRSGLELKLGFYDFVFDHQRSIIGITHSTRLNPHGHDGTANAIRSRGTSGSTAREGAIVGGRMAFLNHKYVSTEWSGHYGHLWNSSIVFKFQEYFFNATGREVHHYQWNVSIPRMPVQNGLEKIENNKELKHMAVSSLGMLGFFKEQFNTVSRIVEDNTVLNNECSNKVASFLYPTKI